MNWYMFGRNLEGNEIKEYFVKEIPTKRNKREEEIVWQRNPKKDNTCMRKKTREKAKETGKKFRKKK